MVDKIGPGTCLKLFGYFPNRFASFFTPYSYAELEDSTETFPGMPPTVSCLGWIRYTGVPPNYGYKPDDQRMSTSHALSCEGIDEPIPLGGSRATLQTVHTVAYCECPQFPNWSWDGKMCVTNAVRNKPQLTLTSAPNQTPPDPRPKGTEGKDPKSSTHELIAKVMEGGMPKAGVAVTFAVEVEPNSGGHDHHDASRPKGLVNGKLTASGVTEANGEIKVTFQASEFSGTHVVAAVCDSCTNKSVTKNVDVKVPGLSPLGHDMGPPQFIYWGSTPKHFSNHWFTIPAKISLAKLVEALVSFEWFPIGINDGSLKWGGSFDVPGHWAVGTNHDEHRIGEEVDISFVMGTNAKKITRSYYELCRDKKIDIPSTILWHDVPISEGGKYAPHFHVRLNGAYTLGARTGKPAGCSRDSEK